MDLVHKKMIGYGALCLIIAIFALGPDVHSRRVANHNRTVQLAKKEQSGAETASVNHQGAGVMRTPINWQKPSENRPYPNLKRVKHLWVKVSLKRNRTYLYDGKKVIYTMYSTGGMYKKDPETGKSKSMTPTGTFHVEAERGDYFFNGALNEGAHYYVSWLHHGTYLFHSVPTKADGTYNVAEAKKLGKSTGSHGCIRLSVADANWMEHHLPVGTKVVVTN